MNNMFHPSKKTSNRRKNSVHREKKNRSNTCGDQREALKIINSIRKKHHKHPIRYDHRAYRLAVARLKDLEKYHYFAHNNPRTNKNPENMKSRYGIHSFEYPAENLFGGGNMNDAIRAWMHSPGHRLNLLQSHSSGAIASYHGKVAFIGIKNYGFKISTNPYLY